MKNKPIYLDNNATTAIDPRVIEVMNTVLETHYGNPASSTHYYGWYAAELVEIAREQVAKCINASSDEIVFTSCATESINLAIKGISFFNLKANKRLTKLVTIPTEHKATLDTAKALDGWATQTTLLSVDEKGVVDEAELIAQLEKQQCDLLSLSLANNEIGSIQNIAKIAELITNISPQTILHVDASQAVGKLPVDVKALGADLLSFSSHKIYGPKGIAALYLNKKSNLKLEPLIHGGGHEQGLRAGTLNVAGIVGFGKACEFVTMQGLSDAAHLKTLSSLFFSNLKQEVPGIYLNGPTVDERLAGNLNICAPGVNNVDLIAKLGSKVAFSISSACTSQAKVPSHVLKAIGLSEPAQRQSFRIGFGRYSTAADAKNTADLFATTIKASS